MTIAMLEVTCRDPDCLSRRALLRNPSGEPDALGGLAVAVGRGWIAAGGLGQARGAGVVGGHGQGTAQRRGCRRVPHDGGPGEALPARAGRLCR